jgi:hypothetical protein
MAKYDELPVYKASYDLLVAILRFFGLSFHVYFLVQRSCAMIYFFNYKIYLTKPALLFPPWLKLRRVNWAAT